MMLIELEDSLAFIREEKGGLGDAHSSPLLRLFRSPFYKILLCKTVLFRKYFSKEHFRIILV